MSTEINKKGINSDGLLFITQIFKDKLTTEIINDLNSSSTSAALSANQGRLLNEAIKSINTSIAGAGKGDMQTSVWDTNNNGRVDEADWSAESDNATKFGGELPSAYVKQTDIDEFIDNVTEIANGKCKSYTFETVEELDAAIAEYVAFITNGTEMSNINPIKGQILNNGDVFLVIDKNVPDYWWDASTNAKQEMETSKVEIEFMTNEEIAYVLSLAGIE